MDMDRRTVIKAGLGLGASLLLRPADIFAQTQPLHPEKNSFLGGKHSRSSESARRAATKKLRTTRRKRRCGKRSGNFKRWAAR